MPIFKNSHRLLIILTIITAFCISFYSHKLRAPKRRYADFHCFYIAGKRILNQQNLYVIRDKEVAEFRYTPIFAVFMSGLALMDEDNADTVWFIVNFSLLVLSIVLLKKIIVSEELDFRSNLILYISIVLGVIRFILHNFSGGQSNILMMSSIIVGLHYISKKREVLGGAMLAFSVMIKYTPLVFIPFFLIRKRIKLSFIIILSIIIYFLLPSLFTGLKTNLFYIRNLIPFLTKSTILDQMTILDPKNQSLLSFINRIFTKCVLYFHAPPMPFQSLNLNSIAINLIFTFLAILLYLSILYKPRKVNYSPASACKHIDYALLLICVVLFNLNAWMPTYILLLMPYFIIVHYLIKNDFKDKTVFILWLFSYVLNFITIKSIFGKTISYKLHFYSPFTISALIAFLVLLKIKFSKNEEKNNR